MLLSTKMMFERLGEREEAQNMEEAIAQMLKEGWVRTYDLGGNSSTLDIVREVASNL